MDLLDGTLLVMKSYSGIENVILAACIVICDANNFNEEKVKKKINNPKFPEWRIMSK